VARSVLKTLESDRLAVESALAGLSPVDAADVASWLNSSRHLGGLRWFQERDLARLLALRHGANFSVPGAGKTTVTYALYEIERVRGRVARLLVVAPMSAFESWIDEVGTWLHPSPRIVVFDGRTLPMQSEVVVVNYQRLVGGFSQLADWVGEAPTHVVLDEAHRAKRGWSGQWGRTCLSLGFGAARRDILTGTPAPNHPRDLLALLDFCWPGQAEGLLPPSSLVAKPEVEAVANAGDVIRPLFVRTTKTELQLPPIEFHVRTIPLDGLQAEIYKALRSRYAGQLKASQTEQAHLLRLGRTVMYLLEAATNPALLPVGSADGDPLSLRHPPLDILPGSRLAELVARYGEYETPRKFVELAALLEENAREGRKTLVWSNFVRNLNLLARETLLTLSPALIHGGVPYEAEHGPSRTSELARFRRDANCMVLLANPAALGEGASLHDVCHDAVYLDRTFNAGQYLQSLDRIHRLGLGPDEVTNITLLLTADTVDTVVNDRVTSKVNVLERLLSDSHLSELCLPDDEDYGQPIDLTRADIEALMGHLRSEP
jgi:SNF2 family DNA or RNA helicase